MLSVYMYILRILSSIRVRSASTQSARDELSRAADVERCTIRTSRIGRAVSFLAEWIKIRLVRYQKQSWLPIRFGSGRTVRIFGPEDHLQPDRSMSPPHPLPDGRDTRRFAFATVAIDRVSTMYHEPSFLFPNLNVSLYTALQNLCGESGRRNDSVCLPTKIFRNGSLSASAQ